LTPTQLPHAIFGKSIRSRFQQPPDECFSFGDTEHFGTMFPLMYVAGLALAASASGSSTLKYFGVWELEQADPVADNVKDFANFLFTSADMGQINRRVGD
jgi:hypothetical protein